jgi:spore germination protein KB
MYLIIGYICGSILLIAFLESDHDSWLVAITGLIAIIPIALCYVWLFRISGGKSLIQIHDMVYGKILGKVLSIFYIFYFLMIAILSTRDVAVFFMGFFMPETPMVFFLVAFLMCCAYAVKKGINALARVSFILVIVVLLTVVVLFLLLLGQMDLTNFFPVFEASADEIYRSTQTMATVPYGEFIMFFMIMPYVDEPKKIAKYSIAGIAIAALVFLNLVFRNTAVLGASSMVFLQPSFETLRLINIGDFFNRIEIIIALNNTSMMFVKSSIVLFCTVKSIEQTFNLREHKPLLIPVSVLVVIFAMTAFATEAEHHYWGRHYAAFFEIPFVVFFPLITLVIAKIRGFKIAREPQEALPPANNKQGETGNQTKKMKGTG